MLYFASVAVLEFDSCIKTGKPVSLRYFFIVKTIKSVHNLSNVPTIFNYNYIIEQQIVDCIGRNGCGGGGARTVFDYVAASGGITSTTAYPIPYAENVCLFN